jgi:hypothetical protein
MSTPLGGENVGVLKKLLVAADPTFEGDVFEPNDFLNKNVKVTIFYPKLGSGIYAKHPRVADISPVDSNSGIDEVTGISSGEPTSSFNLSHLAGTAWQLLK